MTKNNSEDFNFPFEFNDNNDANGDNFDFIDDLPNVDIQDFLLLDTDCRNGNEIKEYDGNSEFFNNFDYNVQNESYNNQFIDQINNDHVLESDNTKGTDDMKNNNKRKVSNLKNPNLNQVRKASSGNSSFKDEGLESTPTTTASPEIENSIKPIYKGENYFNLQYNGIRTSEPSELFDSFFNISLRGNNITRGLESDATGGLSSELSKTVRRNDEFSSIEDKVNEKRKNFKVKDVREKAKEVQLQPKALKKPKKSSIKEDDDIPKGAHLYSGNGCEVYTNMKFDLNSVPSLSEFRYFNDVSIEDFPQSDDTYVYCATEDLDKIDGKKKEYKLTNYTPRILRIPMHPIPRKLKRKGDPSRQGLCPYCPFDKFNPNSYNSVFHNINESNYRSHLISQHGIFTTGEHIQSPQLAFEGRRVKNKHKVNDIFIICPYLNCQKLLPLGSKSLENNSHRLHSYLRHCRDFHYPEAEKKRLIEFKKPHKQ